MIMNDQSWALSDAFSIACKSESVNELRIGDTRRIGTGSPSSRSSPDPDPGSGARARARPG